MKFIKEFKEFAVKGNMMDMAIGIIIGASFNKVIDVLVKKVMMPPLSLMTDGLNFQDKRYVLRDTAVNNEGVITTNEVAIEYGTFFEVSLDFLIVGITVFLVVKAMNRLRTKAH
ncbi:MAG: large conductance mechanosensitive channel protein MscL, partial [Oceanihabitans sp.]|nr:large conductance mechanosensitive channel protein MscL [Oceanihabitans sp.]